MKKWLIGIDEVGRGPLAGPVSVGIAIVPSNFNWNSIPGVNDSKKLTPEKRDFIFKLATKLKQEGELDWKVVSISPKYIDKKGIVPAINMAMERCLKNTVSKNSKYNFKNLIIKLDGGLKAPAEYLHQETIIKGDSKEKVIGLASIVAKVTRDRYMQRISTRSEFVLYDFATNKGYGTKKHCLAIKNSGLSVIHRQSFCRSFMM